MEATEEVSNISTTWADCLKKCIIFYTHTLHIHPQAGRPLSHWDFSDSLGFCLGWGDAKKAHPRILTRCLFSCHPVPQSISLSYTQVLQSTPSSPKYAFYEPQFPSPLWANPPSPCKPFVFCALEHWPRRKAKEFQAGGRDGEARAEGGRMPWSHDPLAPIQHRQKGDRGGPQESIPLAGSKRSADVSHSLPLLGLLLGGIQVSLPPHRPKHSALFHVQPITKHLPSLRRVSPFLERREVPSHLD